VSAAHKEVGAALSDSQQKLAELNAAVSAANAAKIQISDTQGVVAAKSAHIQGAQEHADKVRTELDRTFTAANQHATETEGAKTRAQSAAENAAELVTGIRTVKSTAEAETNAVAQMRKTAEEHASVSKGLAEKAQVIEARIAEYEKRLAELEKEAELQLKTIVTLLIGTSKYSRTSTASRATFFSPLRAVVFSEQ
jgi:chromosome segregation ATPase